MDQPETVTSEREQARNGIIDSLEERDLPEPPYEPPVITMTPDKSPLEDVVNYGRPRNVLDVLELYEYGRSKLTRRDWPRWRETFAVGISADGIYRGYDVHGKTGMLAVFWRTHNPVVDVRVSVPEPSATGSFVYVSWLWNSFGDKAVQALRDHIERTQLGARFVAHHDQRPRSRKRGSIVTVPIGTGVDDATVDQILAERNGHGK